MDGQEGHFLATTNEYDFIILDVMLPKLDGFTLCQKIRTAAIKSPIIMLTVRDQVKDKVRGLDSGADDYITKPFDFEELLARVRVQLRKKREGEPTRYVVGDLILDIITHEV